MRLPRPLPRWAVLFAVVVAVPFGPATAAADVTGDCSVTFNGVPVERIDSLSSPLELGHEAVLSFEGTDALGTTSARVEVILASIPIDQGSATVAAPGSTFAASLELEDVTPYGVGLYRVRGTTDNCTAEAWLRITGRSPFATLAGLTAAGLALGGLLGQIAALAARRRSTPLIAALGGLATGVGGALLGQQFGRLQLSYISLGIVIAGAVVIGGLAGLAFMPRRPERAPERPDAPGRLPHLVAPSPPPAAGPATLRAGKTPPVVETAQEAVPQRTPGAVPEPSPAARPEPAEAGRAPATGIPGPSAAATAAAGVPSGERGSPGGNAGGPAAGSHGRASGADPYWCYVMAPVEAFDLRDHTKVVMTLTPGSWYLARRESGGWAHVVTTTGEEGWVPRRSLLRQG